MARKSEFEHSHVHMLFYYLFSLVICSGMSPNPTFPSPFDAFAAMGNDPASSLLFPNVSPGLLGSNPVISATPFAPYILPSHTPWAGAALNTQQFGNVLPPNHPYLQVLIFFKRHTFIAFLLFLFSRTFLHIF